MLLQEAGFLRSSKATFYLEAKDRDTHVFMQQFLPNDARYRVGSRGHCDVRIFLDHESVLRDLPCWLTRSGAVVTVAPVDVRYFIGIKVHEQLRGQSLWNDLLLEKIS